MTGCRCSTNTPRRSRRSRESPTRTSNHWFIPTTNIFPAFFGRFQRRKSADVSRNRPFSAFFKKRLNYQLISVLKKTETFIGWFVPSKWPNCNCFYTFQFYKRLRSNVKFYLLLHASRNDMALYWLVFRVNFLLSQSWIQIHVFQISEAIRRLLSAFNIVFSAFSAFFGNAENKFSYLNRCAWTFFKDFWKIYCEFF